jgi:hypothetical protein
VVRGFDEVEEDYPPKTFSVSFSDPPAYRTRSWLLGWVGSLLVGAGLCLVLYFWLVYDTSVPVGVYRFGERVHNIGLMQERQIGVLIGFGCMVGGTVLIVVSRLRR